MVAPPADNQEATDETSDGDEDEDEQRRSYTPQAAVTLGITPESARVAISSFYEDLAIEPGDYVQVVPEGDTIPSEQTSLLYSQVEATAEDAQRQLNITRVNESSAGNIRVDVPKNYVTESILGIDSDEYAGQDPLVFQPYYDPGGTAFGLTVLGRASELFGNPMSNRENPLTRESRPKYWTEDELTTHTSYDPTAGSESSDGTFSVKHAQQLYRELNDASSALGSDPAVPKDFIITEHAVSDTIFYRWGNRWETINRSTLESWRPRLPVALTATLFKRTGEHSGYDPIVLERDGMRYEIHTVDPMALVRVGDSMLGIAPAVTGILRWRNNRTARQFVEEIYAARGEAPPDDHLVFRDQYDSIVLPVGEAQTYPEATLATPVDVRGRDLVPGVADGTVETVEQARSVAEGDEEVLAELDLTGSDDTTETTDSGKGEAADGAEGEAADSGSEQATLEDLSGEPTAEESSESESEGGSESESESQQTQSAYWDIVAPFDREELVELHEAGHDPVEIAERLDTTVAMVKESLTKLE